MSEPIGRLRGLGEDDLKQIWQWRNSDRVRNCMFSQNLIGWEEHLQWFQRYKESNQQLYYIFEYEGEPAGVVNFTAPDKNGNSYWGFYLGKDSLPKGTGTLMGKLAIELGISQLKVRKLCAEVLAFNIASIQMHVKLGFRKEGVFARHVWVNGKYEDVICFAHFGESLESEVDK